MFRRKKKEEEVEQAASAEAPEASLEASADESSASPTVADAAAETDQSPVAAGETATQPATGAEAAERAGAVKSGARSRGNRVQKVGIVSSDKMQKTVVVRVDRLVLHRKYRRYVRRTSKFMAHDELGSTTGDRVRIVETRPLSARKRWRVVEIVQKAAK